MAVVSLKYKSKQGTLTAPGDVDPGAMIPIATTTLSTATATITFSSIPQVYEHLQLRISGGTAAGNTIEIQFNSDTGNNYSIHRITANNGSSIAVGGAASQTRIALGAGAGLNFASSVVSGAILDILDYANTSKNKTTRSITGWDSNSAGYLDFESGAWYSTAAINRIDLKGASSSNWVSGSTVALYGIKRAGA